MDALTLGVSDASFIENDVTDTVDTASTANTAASAHNVGGTVDFAHGTTRASAVNIVDNGLSYDAGLEHIVGSVEPGSFFTIKVNPSNPSEALSTAAFWAKRHDGPLCVLVCRLPRSVIGNLEGAASLIHTIEPTQSIFRPASFEAMNREAEWIIVDFER